MKTAPVDYAEAVKDQCWLALSVDPISMVTDPAKTQARVVFRQSRESKSARNGDQSLTNPLQSPVLYTRGRPDAFNRTKSLTDDVATESLDNPAERQAGYLPAGGGLVPRDRDRFGYRQVRPYGAGPSPNGVGG